MMSASIKSIAALPRDCVNPPPVTASLAESLSSLTLDSDKRREKPDYRTKPTQDGGLACLLSQLGRINNQIRHNDAIRKVLSDYVDEYNLQAQALLTKSTVDSDSRAKKSDDGDGESHWVRFFDDEVGAEYYYNQETGEASWVDPDA